MPAGTVSDGLRRSSVRHPGRWIAAAIVALIAASLIRSAIDNPNFHWDVVGNYLFDQRILKGVVKTIELTVLVMLIGVVLGASCWQVMRLSPKLPDPRCQLVLYLGVPGDSAARADPVLGFISALYPTIDPRHSVRPFVHPSERE